MQSVPPRSRLWSDVDPTGEELDAALEFLCDEDEFAELEERLAAMDLGEVEFDMNEWIKLFAEWDDRVAGHVAANRSNPIVDQQLAFAF